MLDQLCSTLYGEPLRESIVPQRDSPLPVSCKRRLCLYLPAARRPQRVECDKVENTKRSTQSEIRTRQKNIAGVIPLVNSPLSSCEVRRLNNEQIFVSSANFTEARQDRNIEVGLA